MEKNTMKPNAVSSKEVLEDLSTQEYKWGFVTPVESETVPKGLNEGIVRLISSKKKTNPIGCSSTA